MKYEKSCKFCGVNFESTKSNAKFCGNNCRTKNHYKKEKTKPLEKEVPSFIETNKVEDFQLQLTKCKKRLNEIIKKWKELGETIRSNKAKVAKAIYKRKSSEQFLQKRKDEVVRLKASLIISAKEMAQQKTIDTKQTGLIEAFTALNNLFESTKQQQERTLQHNRYLKLKEQVAKHEILLAKRVLSIRLNKVYLQDLKSDRKLLLEKFKIYAKMQLRLELLINI